MATPEAELSDFDRWLQANGLGQHAAALAAERVDFDVLSELTDDDLRDLGLPLGDRKRLRRAIDERRAPATSATPAQALPALREVAPPAESAGEAERRQVTIIFCDLVDSTRLAGRLDPEELAEVMTSYQRCCETVVARWDGHLAEFLGDGAVVYFGWPVAHEDDAARAVHAALELTRAAGQLDAGAVRLSARAGIATGLVVVGDIKSATLRKREGAVGTTPNLAARIQSLAPPGGVAISARTRKLIGEQFLLQDMHAQVLKGIEGPVDWWLVNGVPVSGSRFDTRAGAGARRMVGRDAELASLLHEWDRGYHGDGRAVLITGEAGIGKSRLLQSLAERTMADAREPVALQCSPFYRDTALNPVAEWVRRTARLSVDLDAGSALDRLESFIRERGIDVADALPLLATLLSVPLDGRASMPSLSPLLLRERTIERLLDLLVAGASAHPLLVLVEDLHWADPTSIDLLTRLIARRASVPGLLVMTARPEFVSLFDERECVRIAVDRLPLDDIRSVVDDLAGGRRLPDAVFASIVAAAGGVPLFIEELTKSLIESGRLRTTGDSYELHAAASDMEIPATLHDLLVARLDSLGPAKAVCRVAATLGLRFSRRLLARVLSMADEQLDTALQRLCDSGVLESTTPFDDDAQFSFRHALVREAAYQSQLKSRRRDIHLETAAVLETHFPGIALSEPEMLAHHHAEGGQAEPATVYYLAAASRAMRSSALSEALSHLTRGLNVLEGSAPSLRRDRLELRLRAALGTTYMQARGWAAPEVERSYLAAASLSAAAESTAEEIQVLWGTWVYYQVRGRFAEALAAAAQIQERAERDGTDASLLVADMIGLQVHLYAGDPQRSRAHCRRFRERYDAARFGSLTELYSTDLELVCVVHEALACWITGDTDDALTHARHARALSVASGHPYSMSWSHTWGGVVELLTGDVDVLEPSLQLGAAVAGEHGYAYVAAMAHTLHGWLRGERGDLVDGLTELREGLAAFRATGAEIAVPFFQGLEAELLLRDGRADEALVVLAAAQHQVTHWGERWTEAEVHRLVGKALTVQAGTLTADAEVSYRTALHVAAEQGAHNWALRAARDLASALIGVGRERDAQDVLDAVRMNGILHH
ncbi:adenylate/guanylate cyclase domain-containing protein [Gemmatimonas sp.]|uniref:AAA family ATPase n=1 Tax=Gemmatimonas sp. TaxID=1962908 RepID=UPI0033400D94